jgi:hypothetical protein
MKEFKTVVIDHYLTKVNSDIKKGWSIVAVTPRTPSFGHDSFVRNNFCFLALLERKK